MRWLDALGGLPEADLDALASRWGVEVDPDKRLGPVEQVARALVPHPALANLAEWAPALRVAVERLAASPDGLDRGALGGAAVKLLEARLAFPANDEGDAALRLVMPGALRLGVPPSARDPAHAARALLAAPMEDDVARAIASTHEVRAMAGPLALRLERALLHLEDAAWVARVVDALPAAERRLLDGVDARGGVLPVGEVLELEGASARYTTSRGSVLPRRSVAFELVRRGFLLPDGPGTLVVPAEVGAVIGAPRREVARRARRRAVDEAVRDDLAPARARLGADPGPVTAALLVALGAAGVDVHGPRGVPKTALRRAASALGLSVGEGELLASLARGAGAPGTGLPLRALGATLVDGWLSGGAWDEARRPRDRARAGERLGRLPTPTPALREAVLDVLRALPRGRFATRAAVRKASVRDLRVLGAEGILARTAEREGPAFETDPAAVVDEILDVTLPALGLLDVGEGDDGPVLRPNRFFRRALDGGGDGEAAAESPAPGPGGWLDDHRLEVGDDAPLRALVALAPGVGPVVLDGRLVLRVDRETLAAGLDAGLEPDAILERLGAVGGGPPPDAVGALLRALHEGRVPCRWRPAAAFLDVPDAGTRERLREAHGALFLEDSPDGGLLVRPGVTPARVRKALDRVGARFEGPPPSTRKRARKG